MLRRTLRRSARRISRLGAILGHHRIQRDLVKRYFSSPEEFERYRHDLNASKIIGHLDTQRKWFDGAVSGETVRGNPYNFGEIDVRTSLNLYAIVRHLQPRILVETGVCNGVSTAFILRALHDNGQGHLYSIDLPEVAGQDYGVESFWEGKRGAVVPPGKPPGWVIPKGLRSFWTLIEGRSQDKLGPLLKELGEIDFFLHDSEHSFECMSFEFELAYPALKTVGLLASDDYRWNNAFSQFALEREKQILRIGPGTAFIEK